MLAVAGLTVTEATGTFVTVMVAVPLLPSLVAVIVADPSALLVTTQLALTAASAALLVAQVTTRPESVPPAESLVTAESCVEVPTVIVADEGVTVTEATGTGETARVAVADWPSLVPVIVVLPADTPAARPPPLTVAAAGLLLTHVIARPLSGLPAESIGTAVNCCVRPTMMPADEGDRARDATDTVLTVTVAESWTEPPLACALTLYCPGAPGALYRPRCTAPIEVSVMLPAVAVHVMGAFVVSPVASSATAYRSAVWFSGTTTDDGEMMSFDGWSFRDARDGILQEISARMPTKTASRIMASRQDSLCLKIIYFEPPKKKPPALVDSLAARRTWRFGRGSPVALRHRLSTALL